MNNPLRPLLIALALLAAGCSSVPERQAPILPDDWFSAPQPATDDGATAQPEQLANWWEVFDDPQVASVVQRAMQRNRDVQLAMLQASAARSQLRLTRAGLFPALEATGSATRQWIGNDQDVPPDSPLAALGLGGDTLRLDMWELALEASWELDLFGATGARVAGARALVRSAQAEAMAARIAVGSSAAQAYIQIRALQAQRELLQEGIGVAEELERVAGRLFEVGEVARLDVESAAAERASLQADLGELDISLAQAMLALDNLLAEPPGTLAREFAEPAPVPLARTSFSAGQPVDLLRRRPDLIAAAAQLDASSQQSLAARRDLFPTVAVQVAAGRSGVRLNNDLSSASPFGRVAALFGLPLIDFGRRQTAIELADLEGDAALVGLRQAVADALLDVEQGLVAIEGQSRRHAALSAAHDHYRRAHELARTSYRLGEANLNEVLNAQRGELRARQQYISGRTALASAQVGLFVALGGGWQTHGQ
jgi:outer membrane protein, multidrug efflux system